MSWRMLTFACDCGNLFEDLADSSATHVPCTQCGRAADRVRVPSAPAVRGSGESLSDKERKQAFMDFGGEVYDQKKKAWKIESKGDLKKLLKKHGKVAVSDKDFNTMLEHHASINEREQNREPTKEEREKRRAELKPVIDRAKQLVRSGNMPIAQMPHNEAAIPSDVRSAIPDAAKAATGLKETA